MSTRITESETEAKGMRTQIEEGAKSFDLLETDVEDSIDTLVYLNDSEYNVERNEGFFRAEDLPKALLYPTIENDADLYLYDDVFVGGPIKYSLNGEERVIGRVVSSLGLQEYEDLEKIYDSEGTEFLNNHYNENLFVEEEFYEEEIPFQDLLTSNRTLSED